MAYWLLKTEPDCYSWDNLVRDGRTTWDDVTNATALIHLRKMKTGDLALIYHTGTQRACVGLAQITSLPYPDPKSDDPRIVVVDVKPLRKLARAVSLDQIKSDPAFAGWELVRIGRLGVMPVPSKLWKRIERMSRTGATDSPKKSIAPGSSKRSRR